jgi:hypothetical protein
LPERSPFNRSLLGWIGLGLALGLGLAGLARVLFGLGPQSPTAANALMLVSMEPKANAVGAATGSILLDFNQPVDLQSLKMHWSIAPATPGTFTVSGTQVRFVPSAPFPAGQRVSLTLGEGIVSQTGAQGLASDVSWSFTVRRARLAFLAPSQAPHTLKSRSLQSDSRVQDIPQGETPINQFSLAATRSHVCRPMKPAGRMYGRWT